jgi:hypothetical protein
MSRGTVSLEPSQFINLLYKSWEEARWEDTLSTRATDNPVLK